MKTKRRTWTMLDRKWLKQNKNLSLKEKAAHFGVSEKAVDATRRRLKLPTSSKGGTPHNKGKKQEEYLSPEGHERVKACRFKPGHEGRNKRKVGDVFLLKSRGIYCIVTEGNRNYPYGRWLYEQAYGKLGASMVVGFRDGNPKNCVLSNLIAETRRERFLRMQTFEIRSKTMKTKWLVRRTFQEFGIRDYKKAS